jgi:uncharacterized protein (TIGR03067 family)
MRRFAFLLSAAALILVAADDKDEVKKELECFQGTWKFESIEVGGQKFDVKLFKDASLVLEGDKFTQHEGKQVTHGTFKVDLSKKPKTLDVTFTDGPEKGKTMLGIYELDGDTYKACFDLTGKERPTKFESKKGTMVVLEVLKREKKKE